MLTDRDAANNALILLEAFQATATYDWLIALALLVDNTLILAGTHLPSRYGFMQAPL